MSDPFKPPIVGTTKMIKKGPPINKKPITQASFPNYFDDSDKPDDAFFSNLSKNDELRESMGQLSQQKSGPSVQKQNVDPQPKVIDENNTS